MSPRNDRSTSQPTLTERRALLRAFRGMQQRERIACIERITEDPRSLVADLLDARDGGAIDSDDCLTMLARARVRTREPERDEIDRALRRAAEQSVEAGLCPASRAVALFAVEKFSIRADVRALKDVLRAASDVQSDKASELIRAVFAVLRVHPQSPAERRHILDAIRECRSGLSVRSLRECIEWLRGIANLELDIREAAVVADVSMGLLDVAARRGTEAVEAVREALGVLAEVAGFDAVERARCAFPGGVPEELREDFLDLVAGLLQGPLALYALSPKGFELFVARMLERDGWRCECQISEGYDGGVDVRATRSGEILLVQCKRYGHGSVRESAVSALANCVGKELGARGRIVTTGRFTKAARSRAARLGGLVELVDGVILEAEMKTKGVAVRVRRPAKRAPATSLPLEEKPRGRAR